MRVTWMDRKINVWVFENIKVEWTVDSMVTQAELSYFDIFFRYCEHSNLLYTGLFLELSFSKSGGVHDRLHISPLSGIFYFHWHIHQIEGANDL